jgi:hypothetical protein
VLDKDDYTQIIGRFDTAQLEQRLKTIKLVSFFKEWSKKALLKLSYFFSLRTFGKN